MTSSVRQLRLAVTGAGGLLGGAVVEAAMARGHVVIAGVHRVRRAWPTDMLAIPLDLTLPRSTEKFIERAEPDWVVHTAAMTDVDRCEQDPAAAIILNVASTRFLVEAVHTAPTRLLYLSTDYVFNGEHGPYAEDDPVDPINVYGRTKQQGEAVVADDGDRHVIVRSASFLGVGSRGRPAFVDAMIESMRQSPPLRAATDQFSNITPVDYLAAAIVEICERGLEGIWHIAGWEIISRYELAHRLAELSGLPGNAIEGVKYRELGRPAARPLRGGLRVDKAAANLATPIPTLAESLAEWRTAAHTDLS